MKRPSPEDVRIFPAAADFRRWLEEHHATDKELWVGYYRKSIAKPSVTYAQSVEEALCFGWIDGITYRIDDELYTTRFTPRRRRSNWSAPNVQRVHALLTEGRMRPAGVAAFDARTARPSMTLPRKAPR